MDLPIPQIVTVPLFILTALGWACGSVVELLSHVRVPASDSPAPHTRKSILTVWPGRSQGLERKAKFFLGRESDVSCVVWVWSDWL